jgi:hypothetical protein
LCIEPSAGNGAFIEYIKTLSKNCKFFDLKPENKEIIELDYLKLDNCRVLSGRVKETFRIYELRDGYIKYIMHFIGIENTSR